MIVVLARSLLMTRKWEKTDGLWTATQLQNILTSFELLQWDTAQLKPSFRLIFLSLELDLFYRPDSSVLLA